MGERRGAPWNPAATAWDPTATAWDSTASGTPHATPPPPPAARQRPVEPALSASGPDGEIHDPTDLCRPADYPQKIISHKEGRERALEAYRAMKED